MALLYDIIFLFFSLFYLPFLLFKRKAHKGIFQRLGMASDCRLGLAPIWIHAVSVGEVRIASILVKAIRKKTNRPVVISTVTSTGNNLAHHLLENHTPIIYAPLDISFIVNRFLSIIQPSLFLIIETELWPNLISALHKKGTPIALINGRISPRSFSGYSRIKFLTRIILNKISLFCMQADEDKKRIVSLGAPLERVRVTGSMKFDDYLGPSKDKHFIDHALNRLDYGLKENEQLLIAASTHHNEEEIVLKTYKSLLAQFPQLRLLIAPRHIERVSEVEGLIERFGFGALRFSQRISSAKSAPIVILDTIGQLKQLYKYASVVFVGGSLVKKGGQNILEPAFFAKPIIFGPYMFNFAGVSSVYLSKQAAVKVENGEGLTIAVRRILADLGQAEDMGRRARKIIFENCGATGQNIDLIGQLINLE